jgi:hypothetical protein
MRVAEIAAVVALLLVTPSPAKDPEVVDRAAVQGALDAFAKNCGRDNGRLWGVSLCGPIVVVDPQTRDAVASDGWSGKLPNDVGIANTAFDWRGARWSMVRWPLPQNEDARDRLLLHERFHAIQDRIGLPMSPPGANGHLDTLEGRYLMRLEMRALREERLRDALAARRVRFEKFKGAQESEDALDRSEGLAEYTGVKLFTTDRKRMRDAVDRGLEAGEKSDSLPRSYAYATGPAWGLVLDEHAPGWRKRIAHSSFEQLLARYDSGGEPAQSKEILAEEQKREADRQARIASYQHRFIDGPVIVLPLRRINMQMNPYDVHSWEGHGTVYEHITVSDLWGKIVVTGGALINDKFTTLTVPLRGYELTLAPGYQLTVEKP